MSTLLQEFANLTQTLNEKNIDYAVCGGWAMAIHGFNRATLDIDLLILSEDLEQVWETAQSFGYDVEGLPLHFDKGAIEIRRISKIDKESKILITLDFLLVTEALKDVWAGRRRTKWNKGEFWVVSREGMIFMKEISGRDKDLIDLNFLREVNDES
jgi:hypothetical protein